MASFADLDLSGLRVLLCDADGNLFPSEEPAFVASARVTNAFLASMGATACYLPEDLRLATTGKNFRATAVALCLVHDIAVDADLGAQWGIPSMIGKAGVDRPVLTARILEHWVGVEKRTVTEHLRRTLRPDPGVREPLTKLAAHVTLSAVSSSASMRLAACFAATALDEFFPAAVTFSAEDSLALPKSKPDPAIYRFAGQRLGCVGAEGLAIEDSVPGAQSAVGAGFPTVANLQFVPSAERSQRWASMQEAGATAVVESWSELAEMLLPHVGRP